MKPTPPSPTRGQRVSEPVTRFARAVIGDRLRTATRLSRAVRTRPTEKLVHDVRVACRRARDAAAFFRGVPGVPALRAVNRSARRLAKAVRTVRELGVAIRTLRAVSVPRNSDADRTRRAVLVTLRGLKRDLCRDRRTRVVRRARSLERAVADALLALGDGSIQERDRALERFVAHRVARKRAKTTRRVRRLARPEQGAEPSNKTLHRVRVSLKHWRYAEEIALLASPDDPSKRALVNGLRHLQDAGGRTQDLADLRRIVWRHTRGRAADGAGGLLVEIERRQRRAAAAFASMLGVRLRAGGQKS